MHRRALVARFEVDGEFSSSNAAWEAASFDCPASLNDMRVISCRSTGRQMIQKQNSRTSHRVVREPTDTDAQFRPINGVVRITAK